MGGCVGSLKGVSPATTVQDDGKKKVKFAMYIAENDISGTSGPRKEARIQSPGDGVEGADTTMPAPKRRGRKGTGCVTKEQLLKAMLDEQRDGEKADRRVRIQAPEDDADAADQAEAPAPKRKGRKATGLVTKEQLLAALQQEVDDEDDQDTAGGPRGEPSSKAVRIVEPRDTDDTDKTHEEYTAPAPRRRGRKATGGVTKEQLLALATRDDSEGAEIEWESEEVCAPAKRAADRKGTGYVTKEDLKALERRVKIVAPEDAGQGSEPLPAPKRKGRKATGVVTKDQLLAMLQKEEEEEEKEEEDQGEEGLHSESSDSDSSPKWQSVIGRRPIGHVAKEDLQAADRAVRIRTPSDDEEDSEEEKPWRQSAGRKGTGHVAMKDIAPQTVRFDISDEDSTLPSILMAPKRRGRKATGVVTKEQLLQALEAADREGKVVSINANPKLSDDMDEEELPQGAWRRSAGRKGTAFVPKAEAEAESPLVEVDANRVSPAWLCCGGAGR